MIGTEYSITVPEPPPAAGTIVVDRDGQTWQQGIPVKHRDGRAPWPGWLRTGSSLAFSGTRWIDLLADHGPVKVVYVPGDSSGVSP